MIHLDGKSLLLALCSSTSFFGSFVFSAICIYFAEGWRIIIIVNLNNGQVFCIGKRDLLPFMAFWTLLFNHRGSLLEWPVPYLIHNPHFICAFIIMVLNNSQSCWKHSTSLTKLHAVWEISSKIKSDCTFQPICRLKLKQSLILLWWLFPCDLAINSWELLHMKSWDASAPDYVEELQIHGRAHVLQEESARFI